MSYTQKCATERDRHSLQLNSSSGKYLFNVVSSFRFVTLDAMAEALRRGGEMQWRFEEGSIQC